MLRLPRKTSRRCSKCCACHAKRGGQLITLGAASFCVAGATLGAPPARFAWQVQHLEHPKARFAWQVQHLEHLHRGPRKSGDNGLLWAPLRFCVAGAALGTLQARLAWRAQHLEHLRRIWRGRCSTWSTFIEVRGSPATSDYFGRRLVLRGRCSTWSTSGLFGVAGAALGALSCGPCSNDIHMISECSVCLLCCFGECNSSEMLRDCVPPFVFGLIVWWSTGSFAATQASN